jgi:hypothetical protein
MSGDTTDRPNAEDGALRAARPVSSGKVRCPACHGTITGTKRGKKWLERALAVHEQTCPGRHANRC